MRYLLRFYVACLVPKLLDQGSSVAVKTVTLSSHHSKLKMGFSIPLKRAFSFCPNHQLLFFMRRYSPFMLITCLMWPHYLLIKSIWVMVVRRKFDFWLPVQIDYVEFERHAAGGSNMHYFDLLIRLKTEQEHLFRNIQRNEYHNLFDFIRSVWGFLF